MEEIQLRDDQRINHKLAVALALIKLKPQSLTGKEFAILLAQRIRKHRRRLISINRKLREENLRLRRQLSDDGDSSFCSVQREKCSTLTLSEKSSFGFLQSVISLRSHLNCSDTTLSVEGLAEDICRSLGCLFSFYLDVSAFSFSRDTLEDAVSTVVTLCDAPWPQDVTDVVHVSCLEFVENILKNMNLPDLQVQRHYSRLLGQLGKSRHLWSKLCSRLVREVEAFGAGVAQSGIVDPILFQAVYGTLRALEILWSQPFPKQTFPGEMWACHLESSLRFVWECLPLFHIYVSFLQTRLAHLMKSAQIKVDH